MMLARRRTPLFHGSPPAPSRRASEVSLAPSTPAGPPSALASELFGRDVLSPQAATAAHTKSQLESDRAFMRLGRPARMFSRKLEPSKSFEQFVLMWVLVGHALSWGIDHRRRCVPSGGGWNDTSASKCRGMDVRRAFRFRKLGMRADHAFRS